MAFHATQDPISGNLSPAMSREESGSIAVAYPDGMVRRLTPTECERLQALPDGLDEPIRGRARLAPVRGARGRRDRHGRGVDREKDHDRIQ